MMKISKRQYYCNFTLTCIVVGLLINISGLIANKYLFKLNVIHKICFNAIMLEIMCIMIACLIIVMKNSGFKNYISKQILISSIENNLISIGAYTKQENKVYVTLPKIRIDKGTIIIGLDNLRIRNIIQRYLDSFSTALPERFVVEDYYISSNNAEIIIEYEDIEKYKPEEYMLADYREKIMSLDWLDLYFDKKHIVNVNDYPHFLISGASGSGKSFLVNELVIQAIIKGWEVVICDLKRTYGLYASYTEYSYEIDDIVKKLQSVEAEMFHRMEVLQPELDKNPKVLAVDKGFAPKLVVIEEYISLQSSLEKKQKEELERVVKNISVLARQSNIHLIIALQSAGTENINSTIRNNLTKLLLGRAQSNILTMCFGTGIEIPNINTKLNKGEGLMQLDKITRLRVPNIIDIEDFKDVIGNVAEGKSEPIS